MRNTDRVSTPERVSPSKAHDGDAARCDDDDDDDDDDAEGDEELTVRGCKRGGDRSASERRRMKTLPRATRAPPCGKPPGAQTSVSNGDLD